MGFYEKKEGKWDFNGAKKAIKVWDIDVNNVVTSKLTERKNNSKYLLKYLDKVIGQLVFYYLEWIDVLRHS